MPSHLQQSLAPLQQQVTETADALGAVYKSDVSAGEKANKALATLRERVPPVVGQVVELAKQGIAGAVAYVQHAGQTAKENVKENGNGTALSQ